MIIWTPLDLEQVLDDGKDAISPREEMIYQGKLVEVERLTGNQMRLVRLLSNNPEDYLDENFKPGREITLGPI